MADFFYRLHIFIMTLFEEYAEFDDDFLTIEERRNIIGLISKIPEPAEDEDFQAMGYNFIKVPTDDNLPRNVYDLLVEIHSSVLPKLLRVMKRFPKGSLITVGMSLNPRSRDNSYNAKKEFIRRDSRIPVLCLQEQVVYESNCKYNALCVEYLLQHMLRVGLWKKSFSVLMNPQRRLQPYKSVEIATPYYVYVKFSTTEANLNIVHVIRKKL